MQTRPAAPRGMPPGEPLRFGGSAGDYRFELQPAERRLLVDGKPAPLGGRAFDVLAQLVARPDHLLTKGELLDLVWPGLVVEESNLQVQIANLRKLLGGDVIATVPGRGYRFVGVVAGVEASGAAVPGYPGAESPAGASAAAGAVSAASPPLPPPTPTRPAQTTLFGRTKDLSRLNESLAPGACITLVGTSGVGKTSLARAAVAQWKGRTIWVDLAPLAHASQVAGAIARALGAQASDADAASHLPQALQQAAQPDSLLLVLDNAEHVVQWCADVVASLVATPNVCVLVTSQVPLAIAGERVQRLEPLALADGDASFEPDDALALLIERITAADHRFTATPERRPLLRAICRQLDGLPLALEMAAARVPVIGLQGVHDALAQRFSLLTRGRRDAAERHRTLHNALEWSYRLLSPLEQKLFRALGVFAGGFTLDLAVALITDNADARWDVVDGLASLVDRSLVVASADDPPRYRLLETLRAFALEQLALAESGTEREEFVVRRRHASAMLAAFPPMRSLTGSPRPWLAEMLNAREAIAWARTQDLGVAVQLVARVASLSTFTVWRLETTAWLCSLRPDMDSERGLALPAELQATWWAEFARVTSFAFDPQAPAAARRALSLWKSLHQPTEVLHAAIAWVRSVKAPGAELDAACAALDEAAESLASPTARERLGVQGARSHAALTRDDDAGLLVARLAEAAIAREMNWAPAIDATESNVVTALNRLERYAEAVEMGAALLARIDRTDPDSGNLPWVTTGLFDALLGTGRLEEARALVPRMCANCRRFRSVSDVPLLPMLAVRQRSFEAAAQLVGYAYRVVERYAASLERIERDALAASRAAAAAALGNDRVDELLAAGAALDDDAAAQLAAAPPPGG